jgi:predicted dehydrogenase
MPDGTIKKILHAGLRRLRRKSSAPLRDRPSGRQPLRVGVVGLGAFGTVHATQMNRSHFYQVTAICSRSASPEAVKQQFGCTVVKTIEELIANTKLDVIVVATPHMIHKDSVLPALAAGIHVICEKPMAVSCTDAAEMMQAAQDSGTKFTIMSQTRFEPSYLNIRALLDSGQFGEVRRCSLTETFLRSEAYYQNATWRGTWAGEGGGVLVNQAPHVLDRYRWLCGCPDTITAVCETLHHSISVEDSASLTCSHSNGLTGQIHVSTNEHPQARLELVCDRGRIVVQDGSITVTRWTPSLSESIKRTDGSAANPVATTEQLGGTLLNWSDNLLHDFYENFAQAIWSGGEPLVSPKEANDVVHMINAAQLSAWQGGPISLPVQRQQYQAFLERMMANETVQVGK